MSFTGNTEGCKRLVALFLTLLLSGGFQSLAHSDTVTVAVAANFAATLERVGGEFEKLTGHQIRLISGSSGRHYAQIVNGAPFDLFLSADTERPAALEASGLITHAQRRIYARGQLAVWSRESALLSDLSSLQSLPPDARLAIANPRLAPYGRAALEALSALGLYTRFESRLVMGENVGQVFQFAFSGNAAAGMLAYSQVLSAPVQGSVILLPESIYAPIEQEMVLLRHTPASEALFEFLSSATMEPILRESGYLLPETLKPAEGAPE